MIPSNKAGGGGIQYVEYADGHGDKLFAAAYDLGLYYPPPHTEAADLLRFSIHVRVHLF